MHSRFDLNEPKKSSGILQTEVCFLTKCKDQLITEVEKIYLEIISHYTSGKEQGMVVYGITLTNIPTQPVIFLPSFDS